MRAYMVAVMLATRSFAELCTLQTEDGAPLHLEDIQLLQCDSMLCLRLFPAPFNTIFAEFAGVPRHDHYCVGLTWNGEILHAWVVQESPCCITLERMPQPSNNKECQ